jgi:hypothetical protein
MKNIIIMVLFCLFSVPVIALCQDKNLPPEWVFDDKDEIKNWGGANQLQPLVIETVKNKKGDKVTIVKTVSTGTDPYIFPDGGWSGFIAGVQKPFDGKKYPIIYIGVRANVTSTWQIYYYTDQDSAYTERQVQNFPVDASDDFLDLEFKMTVGGWQEEEIRGFRLDPGTLAGVEAEIDYLSIRGVPGGKLKAVESKGKLAVTWGEVKQQ